MENPVYTFATPTIISGDRENVDVIAHELSHSWSGNLVSNASWEHLYVAPRSRNTHPHLLTMYSWLNEGWTVYLERRILAAIHGDTAFDFSSIIGWSGLGRADSSHGKVHPVLTSSRGRRRHVWQRPRIHQAGRQPRQRRPRGRIQPNSLRKGLSPSLLPRPAGGPQQL